MSVLCSFGPFRDMSNNLLSFAISYNFEKSSVFKLTTMQLVLIPKSCKSLLIFLKLIQKMDVCACSDLACVASAKGKGRGGGALPFFSHPLPPFSFPFALATQTSSNREIFKNN